MSDGIANVYSARAATMGEERTILGRIEPWLRGIALVIWAFIGLTRFDGSLRHWVFPWLTYGALVALFATRERWPFRLRVAVLAAQSASVYLMPLTGLVGFEGMLLSFVVVQLPTVLSIRASMVWAVLQLVVLWPVVLRFNNLTQMFEMSGAYGGFSAFALMVHHMRATERRARAELARANAQLLATRALVVEGSQQAERLRISRELHDSLGHHLTALKLQLDLAQRQVGAGVRPVALSAAREVAQGALAEVRRVVSSMQTEQRVDLVPALRALAAGVPTPRIDIQGPDSLVLENGAQGHAVFRCVQEAITNAVRHAGARHVWVELTPGAERLKVSVRDDGGGTTQLQKGRGLSGIGARLEPFGGHATFSSSAGEGFSVQLELPMRAGA